MKRAVTLAAVVVWLATPGDARADRPSPGAGYDQNAELLSYAVPGGSVRVWYVTSSADAPPMADTDPADGVPDYVANAAEFGETSLARFAELGFRPPVVDLDYLPADAAGGDERFDIYLGDLAGAGGSFRRDGCIPSTRVCYGYAFVENDFEGTGYPGPTLGLKIVVSHELFHAVQNAYDAEQDSRWTEGTAVWAEELVFPEQDDYERFLGAFLAKPTRPFDRDTGAAFGDPYPYGAALWPTFLTERYGADFVLRVWEGSAEAEGRDADFLRVCDALLADDGASLADAFEEFTRWNLFTASRADPSRAYRHGAQWDPVALDAVIALSNPVEVNTEGLSARYVPIELGEPSARSELVVSDTLGHEIRATLYPLEGSRLGPEIELVAGSSDDLSVVSAPIGELAGDAILVVSGVVPGTPQRSVVIDRQEAQPPIDDDSPVGDGGGCAAAPSGQPGGGTLLALALLTLRVRWPRPRIRR